MSYASKAGRARTRPRSPEAQAVCQRCGFWTQRNRLINQPAWRGAALLPINIYVCHRCLDVPTEQLRAIVLTADPVPVYKPFTEPFLADETGNSPPYGVPTGLDINAVMPQGVNTAGTSTAYRQTVPVLSITANGTTTVSVTCQAAHGLVSNSQIAVEGLASRLACGFYSVTVTGGTTFTYLTATAVPAGALWQTTSRMITANVGLPLGQTQLTPV